MKTKLPELDNMDFRGYTTTYTKEGKFEIILLKLCTEMEAPLYAFEEIMKWAREAYKDGFFHIRKPIIPELIIWKN
jgi:hypothetical protein